MRPTLPARSSVNQRAPSGAATIRFGNAPGASAYSLKPPLIVIRPTLAAGRSTNQIAPSDPSAPPCGPLFGVGTGISVDWPVVGFNRAIALANCSATYRLPSGAKTSPCGSAFAVGSENSVIVPFGVTRPIPEPQQPNTPRSANQTESSAGSVVIQPTAALLRTGYVVIWPCWSIRPILSSKLNQTLPLGPLVIPKGWGAAV